MTLRKMRSTMFNTAPSRCMKSRRRFGIDSTHWRTGRWGKTSQRARAKPWAKMPHSRYLRNAWRTYGWGCGDRPVRRTGLHWRAQAMFRSARLTSRTITSGVTAPRSTQAIADRCGRCLELSLRFFRFLQRFGMHRNAAGCQHQSNGAGALQSKTVESCQTASKFGDHTQQGAMLKFGALGRAIVWACPHLAFYLEHVFLLMAQAH